MSLQVIITEKGLNLAKMSPEIKRGIFAGLNKESVNLRNYIDLRHLSGGTTNDRLASPSGRLRSSGKIIQPRQEGNDIIAGVEYGGTAKDGTPVKYAHIHIGKRGKKTTISAKPGKALAIPIMSGRTPAGKEATKAKRLKDARKLTFIDRSTKGKPPLLVDTRNKAFFPMYVLKKSVKVKTRVHPNEILNHQQPQILSAVNREIKRAIIRSKAVLESRGKA